MTKSVDSNRLKKWRLLAHDTPLETRSSLLAFKSDTPDGLGLVNPSTAHILLLLTFHYTTCVFNLVHPNGNPSSLPKPTLTIYESFSGTPHPITSLFWKTPAPSTSFRRLLVSRPPLEHSGRLKIFGKLQEFFEIFSGDLNIQATYTIM